MKNVFKISFLPLLIGAALTLAQLPTCFADVALNCSAFCNIKITGTITAQDALVVAKMPARLPKGQRVSVNLNSTGGDVDAAMAIGRVFRSMKSGTTIGMNQECSSACVLLLASGVTRLVALGLTGDDRGLVGIHRLFLMSTSENDYESVQRKYKLMESKVRT